MSKRMLVCVYSTSQHSIMLYSVCSAKGSRHLCVLCILPEPWTLAFPVRSSETIIIRVCLWWSLLDAAQRLMDAPGQWVTRGWELSLVFSLFSGDTPQNDPLTNLSQNAAGVIVSLGRRQGSLVNLPQVEAASLQGGQHLVHGWAHCMQGQEDTLWLTIVAS